MADKKENRIKGKSQRWKLYEASGSILKRKNRFCPKCSEGVFMASHKERTTCGKCGYTEFSSK